MIEDLKRSVLERLEQARAGIAGGSDPEEELGRATMDIEALCDETDRLYCDTVASMW